MNLELEKAVAAILDDYADGLISTVELIQQVAALMDKT